MRLERKSKGSEVFRKRRVTHGQYANSHMKIVGNVFHDWRGMGISVRNSRNVLIADNLFLPPVEDTVLRNTLAQDPSLARGGRGCYAAIHLDSVYGARVSGNRFHGLPAGDRGIVVGQDVTGLVESGNLSETLSPETPKVVMPFSEWFGDSSANTAAAGSGYAAKLKGVGHRAGRLGAAVEEVGPTYCA